MPTDGSAKRFTSNVSAKPGDLLQLRIVVPPAAIGKPVIVRVPTITGPTLSVQTSAAGENATSTLRSSGAGGLKILDVQYRCGLPPTTFCPLTQAKRTKLGLRLELKGRAAPILFNLPLGKPGQTLPAVRLIPRSRPAPGSPIAATVLVRAVGKDAKVVPPTKNVNIKSGGIVQALIRPAVSSPIGGTLRIAIPRTSGKSIEIQAGGTAGKPSSVASFATTSGAIRVDAVAWSCRLPPATFCQINDVRRTPTGLVLALRTPPVPVALILNIAKG